MSWVTQAVLLALGIIHLLPVAGSLAKLVDSDAPG